jgi:hypothetical protein
MKGRAATVIALLLATGVCVACAQGGSQISSRSAPKELPSATGMRFSPGVRVYKFSAPWYVVDSYELNDGTLYLVVEPMLKPPAAAGDVPELFGILSKGIFKRIPIDGAPLSMGMGGMLKGHPVLEVGPNRRYVVIGSHVIPISNSQAIMTGDEYHPRGTDFRLHDGHTCEQRSGGQNSIYTVPYGTREPLVTASEVDAAIPITLGPVSISCHTFDGDDYLDVFGLYILEVRPGKAHLVADGRIYAAGPHHLLISPTSPGDSEPNQPSNYIEAIAP